MDDLCTQCCESGPEGAEELKASLLEVAGLSELFKALADETRTKILYLLTQRELCVCDLASVMDMSLPAVSHHLRLLKTMALVRTRREGKQVFYRLDDAHVVNLIEQAREHYIERT